MYLGLLSPPPRTEPRGVLVVERLEGGVEQVSEYLLGDDWKVLERRADFRLRILDLRGEQIAMLRTGAVVRIQIGRLPVEPDEDEE
jgi:hypothetical protein